MARNGSGENLGSVLARALGGAASFAGGTLLPYLEDKERLGIAKRNQDLRQKQFTANEQDRMARFLSNMQLREEQRKERQRDFDLRQRQFEASQQNNLARLLLAMQKANTPTPPKPLSATESRLRSEGRRKRESQRLGGDISSLLSKINPEQTMGFILKKTLPSTNPGLLRMLAGSSDFAPAGRIDPTISAKLDTLKNVLYGTPIQGASTVKPGSFSTFDAAPWRQMGFTNLSEYARALRREAQSRGL